MMHQFWLAFIPLFVALDGVGLFPMFLGLTQRLAPAQRRRAAVEATVTAFLVAASFLLVSRAVFSLMGLSLADVMVAGGAILLVLSLRDLLLPDEPPKGAYPNPGVVPLGVPLLAGPAVLTTVLLVRDRHGWETTLLALIANMALIWVILRSSTWFMRQLGHEGAQVVSKIFNLILTAFGIMLIRQGVTAMLSAGSSGGI